MSPENKGILFRTSLPRRVKRQRRPGSSERVGNPGRRMLVLLACSAPAWAWATMLAPATMDLLPDNPAQGTMRQRRGTGTTLNSKRGHRWRGTVASCPRVRVVHAENELKARARISGARVNCVTRPDARPNPSPRFQLVLGVNQGNGNREVIPAVFVSISYVTDADGTGPAHCYSPGRKAADLPDPPAHPHPNHCPA